MKYTERLLKSETFLKIMGQVRVLEKDRIYCHHELEHALDVARIAWIYYLEDENRERLSGLSGACLEEAPSRKKEGSDFGKPERTLKADITEEDPESREAPETYAEGKECAERKDLFYVAALLHDIGRAAQYESGVHHSIAGLQIAAGILEEIGFPEKEAQAVLAVVAEHPLSGDTSAAGNIKIASNKKAAETAEESELENDCPDVENREALPQDSILLSYISRADHDCRLCFFCEAKESCKWSEEERNQTIRS